MQLTNNTPYLKTLKIAVGSAVAIIIADLMKLDYGTSAGIIALLSIQDTKKETLLVTAKRAAAFIIAVLMAYITFSFTGYNPLGFGIFLFFFILVLGILRLQDGLSMSAVLITHFLAYGTMTAPLLLNELALFLTGTLTGMLLNLYIPRNTRLIRQDQIRIEDRIRLILNEMAQQMTLCGKNGTASGSVLPPNRTALDELEQDIHEALNRAYENRDNTFLAETRYYIQYMEMRRNQCSVLKIIDTHIGKLYHIPANAERISAFFRHASENLHESNNAEALLEEYDRLKKRYQTQPLPHSRIEFENRAMLFQILNELECFLLLKRDFVLELTARQLKTYWRELGSEAASGQAPDLP